MEGVEFCVADMSKAMLLQMTRNECNGPDCLAIQNWKTHWFLSHKNGVFSFQIDLFEESTTFTVDAARIRDFQGSYLTVDPETHRVFFQATKGDNQLWSLKGIGKNSTRGIVGATILQSVALPKLFLSIK